MSLAAPPRAPQQPRHAGSRTGAAALSLVAAIAAAVVAPVAAAGVFKCTEQGGSVVYQEAPCPPGRELRNFDTDPPDLSVIPPRLVPVTPATSTTPPAPAAAAKPPRDTRTIDGDKAPGKANGDGAARKFVRQGMTAAEDIAKLGRPDATAGGSKQQQTRWSYLPTPDDPDTVTTITFAGGTVSDITRKVIKR